MDIPLFGDAPNKRRREINLGGNHSATSYNDIVSEARLRRLQRNDAKRRIDAATQIQSSWRGYMAKRDVRQSLRATFDQDICSTTALRCLVLLGQDEDALGRWSTVVTTSRKDVLVQCDESSLVLLQRVSRMLLEALARDSRSKYAPAHISALTILLSDNPKSADITQHLISRGFYSTLRNAILQLPVPAAKSSTTLAPLTTLLSTPLSHVDLLPYSLRELILSILTIPLLPNRLLPALGLFPGRLLLVSFNLISPNIIDDPAVSSVEHKVHLLSNLFSFAKPAYSTLPSPAFAAYLQFAASLMNALPTHALEPPEDKPNPVQQWDDDSSDDDSAPPPQVEIVASFVAKPVLPKLDTRTRKRLVELPSSEHMHALLGAAKQPVLLDPLVRFCFALSTVWPARKDKVLSAFFAHGRGALVREIFRTSVRSTPLGKDDTYAEIVKPEYAAHWPPLLLLADLYTQALLTMGDDEFFANGATPNVPRNPLTLDEITAFSRRLLNIAFALYWREDPASAQEDVPGLGQVKWESVREKATRCLQALHARHSRQPFTPPDHWLVTSQVDMNTFIQAAILEEKQLSDPETGLRARAINKRQIAYLSPRLGVLNNIPFAVPFDVRVGIFRRFVANDMSTRGLGHASWLGGRAGPTRVTIRREHISQDGFDRLGDVDVRGTIAITFVDQFGQEEAGIDGGGVFKEFLTSLCKEVFNPDRGLWLQNKKNELYPAPTAYATEPHSLAWYRFIGRILGKALYEGILVDVAFAGFFLAKWLDKQSWLDDLRSLDPELYQGLLFLKHYTGDPKDLTVDYTTVVQEFGVTKSIDLIPNGSNVAVTRENRLHYIYTVAHFRLTKQIKKQSTAFFEGLSEVIDPKWLRMFNQQELQILLGGANTPIDINDLRAHTQYGGLYNDHEHTIQLFWQVVGTFNHAERQKLLLFATSCGRPPLLGFKELNPNFAIRDASDDEQRLPTASTCVNLLKLPRYKTASVLREKLLQAINAKAGFDLS